MKLLCMSLLKIIISFMDSKGGKHEEVNELQI